jgi:hypothetical protein
MTKFCGFDCKHAKPCDDVPGCLTFNPIYCKLQDKMVSKGAVCSCENEEK